MVLGVVVCFRVVLYVYFVVLLFLLVVVYVYID